MNDVHDIRILEKTILACFFNKKYDVNISVKLTFLELQILQALFIWHFLKLIHSLIKTSAKCFQAFFRSVYCSKKNDKKVIAIFFLSKSLKERFIIQKVNRMKTNFDTVLVKSLLACVWKTLRSYGTRFLIWGLPSKTYLIWSWNKFEKICSMFAEACL